MKYTLKGRERKVKRLFFKVLFRFLIFKLFSVFLTKNKKGKILSKLHKKTAKEVSDLFMDLEGLFLKLAQQISTMSNILPGVYIKYFELAQNNSKPRAFAQIKKRIELELGGKIERVFSSIDESPIGTASIGQVHKAKLITGEKVAVKVQHLRIEEIAEVDLDLIKKLLNISQYFMKTPGMNGMFEEVVKMIHEELDYSNEARNITAIRERFLTDNRIVIPNVYSQYSSSKVLVMDFVPGDKITNNSFLKDAGINKEELAKSLLDIFSKKIFIDGLYHADPHPGNILVNEHGQIVLIDFGAVGTLSSSMREGIIILIQAAILKDENLMIAGLKKMGFVSSAVGVHKVCKKLIRLLNDFLVDELKVEKLNISEINFQEINFSNVVKLLNEINLKEVEEVVKIPKDWVLLNRTIALVMGITGELAPEVDVYKEVKPNLIRMLGQKESMSSIFKTTFQQQALRLISLPRKVEVFIEQAENGELEVNSSSNKNQTRLYYHLAQQIVFVLIAMGCYYIHIVTDNKLFYYTSILGGLLFTKSFLYGLYYRRKL